MKTSILKSISLEHVLKAKCRLRQRLENVPVTLFGLILWFVFLQIINTCCSGAMNTYLRNAFALTAAGEWWRLFTAQFIHLDWLHLLVDIACIYIIGEYLWKIYPAERLFCCFIVAGIMGQAFALVAWTCELTHYHSLVGSSDALHGLAYLFLRYRYERSSSRTERQLCVFAVVIILISIIYSCSTGVMLIWDQMKTPGLNHLGGIVAFVIAVEFGFLKPRNRDIKPKI